MIIGWRSLPGTLITTAILHAATVNFAIADRIGFYYGAPYALYMYDFWYGCTLPYRCHDPLLFRLELERQRRLQDLREQATPPDPRVSAGDGVWGLQRYVPPATPESNIQPAYRGVSKLRPEYEQSSELAPPTQTVK